MTGRTLVSEPSAPGPGVDTPDVGARGGDTFVITIAHAAETVPDGWGP